MSIASQFALNLSEFADDKLLQKDIHLYYIDIAVKKYNDGVYELLTFSDGSISYAEKTGDGVIIKTCSEEDAKMFLIKLLAEAVVKFENEFT